MNEETTVNLPAVKPDTRPIPVADGIPRTHPELYPEALDADWHNTGDDEWWRFGPYNWPVYRALEAIGEGVIRERPAKEIVDRALFLLMLSPEQTEDGTPLRCTKCGGTYTVGEGIPDWDLAGRKTGVCWGCTYDWNAPLPEPDKEITITPQQAMQARRRRTARAKP